MAFKVERGLIVVPVVISVLSTYLDVCSLGVMPCTQHTAQSPYNLLRGELLFFKEIAYCHTQCIALLLRCPFHTYSHVAAS